MLDEYAIVPDVFDAAAYSNAAYIDMCLPYLKEPLLQEALVRDLAGGGWSRYCHENSANLHGLCKEVLKKLARSNRLRSAPIQGANVPVTADQWCREGLASHQALPLTGIIAAHNTKQQFAQGEVASVERLTGTSWWQQRSPSVTVDRKTGEYQRVLGKVLMHANSLMFIDPNLDPSRNNYQQFGQLLTGLGTRRVKPRIEVHRSFCKGDGPARTFPIAAEWSQAFAPLGQQLAQAGLSAEVFGWEDFHIRLLIADVIGVNLEWGFDVTTRANEMTVWTRLGRNDKDYWQRRFDPAAAAGSLKWRFGIGAMP